MSDPAIPPPDEKDWTWVLTRPCPDCGYDPAGVEDVGTRTRAAVGELRAALNRADATVRPEPDVWSPVEYACHVRDVCIIFGARLASMRGTHDPQFVNWNQDETALSERYWDQDPATVSGDLAVEGERIAAAFDSVRPEELSRSGRRSDGAVFTVDTLGRYFLHDLEHHCHDVSR